MITQEAIEQRAREIWTRVRVDYAQCVEEAKKELGHEHAQRAQAQAMKAAAENPPPPRDVLADQGYDQDLAREKAHWQWVDDPLRKAAVAQERAQIEAAQRVEAAQIAVRQRRWQELENRKPR